MPNFQTMAFIGVIVLLFMAIAATGYSARRLLTQDQVNPIPNAMAQTLWSVPAAVWVVWGLLRWAICP
jgi:hypothetical protein